MLDDLDADRVLAARPSDSNASHLGTGQDRTGQDSAGQSRAEQGKAGQLAGSSVESADCRQMAHGSPTYELGYELNC